MLARKPQLRIRHQHIGAVAVSLLMWVGIIAAVRAVL